MPTTASPTRTGRWAIRSRPGRHWQRALEILTDLGADITEDEEASTSAIRSNLNALVRRAID